MIKKFLGYYYKKILRYFETNKQAKILVAGLMSLVFIAIAVGIFYVSKRGLEITQAQDDKFMLQAVPLYIYEIFLLITGFLTFVSTIIFGLFSFFKGDRDAWIIASPQFRHIFDINFLRSILHSGWPIIILAVPAIIAIGQVFSFSILEFVLSFLIVLVFSFLVSTVAITLILAISLLLKALNLKKFHILSSLTGIFTGAIGVLIWQRLINNNLKQLFQTQIITQPTLDLMKANFAIFPSHFPAMTVFNLQQGKLITALEYSIVAIIILILLLAILQLIKTRYLYLWQTFQEGAFEAKTQKSDTPSTFLRLFPKSPEQVISKKELLFTLRSPKNLLWFLFLSILLFAQIGAINLLKDNSAADIFTQGVMPAIQIGIVLFFVSAFILKFVFPSFSQESDTGWIIGSAPINLKTIFVSKYRFYSVIISMLGVIAIFFYLIPMNINLDLSLTLLIIILISILSLTMLGLSLGTIFMSFQTKDPQTLSTSSPGIAFMLSSLSYTLIIAYLLYLYISTNQYWPILAFLILSLAIFFLSKYFSLKSLKHLEFY